MYICTCLYRHSACMYACRLLYMVEHCFTKEDKSFQIVHQWFKPSQEPRLDGWKAKTALRELVSRKDDLPACLIFYPINNCPHAIEEAWLTSIGED